MRTYGLTGGIASGKSTAAAGFRAAGAPVVDADALARDVVAPGQPALAEIAARWPAVLGPDGRLDRKALAAIVFADPAARRALEAITHPRIAAAAQAALAGHRAAGAPAAIYEAALLVERGLHDALDGLVVVAVPPAVQLARLMARDRIDEAAAAARIAAQLPLEAKLRVATHVIDNGGTPAETEAQVRAIWAAISG